MKFFVRVLISVAAICFAIAGVLSIFNEGAPLKSADYMLIIVFCLMTNSMLS